MPSSAASRPSARGPARASSGSPRAREQARRAAQHREAHEQPDQEQPERRGADQAGLGDQRDVEAVRPPVRAAGLELVVDRERVQPEPEQRMLVEHGRDEREDLVVHLRRAVRDRGARPDHRAHVVRLRGDHADEQDAAEHRHDELRREELAAKRHREHEQADPEPEEARSATASGSRRRRRRRSRRPARGPGGRASPSRSANGSRIRIGTHSMIPRWFGSSASALTRKTPSETKLPPCTPVA